MNVIRLNNIKEISKNSHKYLKAETTTTHYAGVIKINTTHRTVNSKLEQGKFNITTSKCRILSTKLI